MSLCSHSNGNVWRPRPTNLLEADETSMWKRKLYVGINPIFDQNYAHVLDNDGDGDIPITVHNIAAFSIAILNTTGILRQEILTIPHKASTAALCQDITRLIIIKLMWLQTIVPAKLVAANISFVLDLVFCRLSDHIRAHLWLKLDLESTCHMCTDQVWKGTTFWDMTAIRRMTERNATMSFQSSGSHMEPKWKTHRHGKIEPHITSLPEYFDPEMQRTVTRPSTLRAVSFYQRVLRMPEDSFPRLAFFSSDPQADGIAAMRLSFLQFANNDAWVEWLVPRRQPGMFDLSRKFQQTLQGMREPDDFVSHHEKWEMMNWVITMAHEKWLVKGGPLSPVEQGGAHVIVIDDCQMTSLIPLIKERTPDRPVLYRSHTQIRTDLIAQQDSAQADLWRFLWSHIKHADMFISYPVSEFVPKDVPKEKVAYLPAALDWCDGLNKRMNHLDYMFWLQVYNDESPLNGASKLDFPRRRYFASVSRFDIAKGIPDVITAYVKFRRLYDLQGDTEAPPQLLVCGEVSDDDSELLVYHQTVAQVRRECPHLMNDISIRCLAACAISDRQMNAIISKACIFLQLSKSEGFGVEISRALAASCPVIATNVGGIPLQVKPGINGFLVNPGDTDAVAKHLLDLSIDEDLWLRLRTQAGLELSDDVGLVSNAMCWHYLTVKWAMDGGMEGNERWVINMAREEAGEPYEGDSSRLSRAFTRRATEG